jgi:hypothetical protein
MASPCKHPDKYGVRRKDGNMAEMCSACGLIWVNRTAMGTLVVPDDPLRQRELLLGVINAYEGWFPVVQ